jgi:hypothetical protein
MTMNDPGTRDPLGTPADGDGVEKTPVEASQGAKTGYMRWVLVISLSLGVLALGAAFLGYTASQPNANAPPSAAATTSQPAPNGG